MVVGATPAELLAQGYRQVGRDFPVFLHPDTGEEYALARTERKSGPGYTGFVCHSDPDVTLEQDLERRDFTINAMAQTPAGELVDPYGGERDLRQRVLRHVSAAFVEDPLRVLRGARFAARYDHLGFSLAPETAELMGGIVASGELQYLPRERVWTEFEKTLAAQTPRAGFQVLADCGALQALLPELADIDQALAALDRATIASPAAPVRWAALLAACDEAALEAIARRLRPPNAHGDLARLCSRHGAELATIHSASAALRLLDSADNWRRPERFQEFLIACAAAHPDLAKAAGQLARAASSIDIDTSEWLAAGVKGREVGERVHQARLQALEQFYG